MFSPWLGVDAVTPEEVEVVFAAVADLAYGNFTFLEQLAAMVKQKAQIQQYKIDFLMVLILLQSLLINF